MRIIIPVYSFWVLHWCKHAAICNRFITWARRLSLDNLDLHVTNLDAHQQEVNFADYDVTQVVPGTTHKNANSQWEEN